MIGQHAPTSEVERLAAQIARLEERVADLQRAVPTPWVAPTLLNGWTNFGGADQIAQFRRHADTVQVRGLVKSGTVGFVPVFVLPVGCRPVQNQNFVQINPSTGGTGGVYVDPSGNVGIFAGTNSAMSLNLSFSIY